MQKMNRPAVEDLVREAATANAENQRRYRRYPFFRSVELCDENQHEITAFARDISKSGIGLFHNKPFPSDQFSLLIPTTSRRKVQVSIETRWCAEHDSGWYVSGGRLVGLSPRKASSLFLSAAVAEANRRLKQRFPYFRKANVTIGTDHQPHELAAWTTDISAEGIGLLHRSSMDHSRLTVSLKDSDGYAVQMGVDIHWSERLRDDYDWYVSGGHFTRLSITEMPSLLL